MKILPCALTGLYTLFALIGLMISIGWLLYSVTTWGKAAAILGLALTLLPLAVCRGFTGQNPSLLWKLSSAGLGIVIVGIAAAVLITTPDGQSTACAPICQRFTTGTRFDRYTLANIVPETEQINLGFLVMPAVDPWFTFSQARRDRAFTLEIYQEMDADPNFRRLGSSLGWSYSNLLGGPANVGHYYLYIPTNRPAGPGPVLVFLHGSLGNFKSYTFVLAQLAEENGMILVAPSYGFGDWDEDDGVEAVLRVLEDLKSVVEYDESQVYLMGLSNGGKGITYLADAHPEKFQGLIYVSPVMPGAVDQERFRSAWRGRPVLILTGEADERIPIGYVLEKAANMAGAGVEVKLVTYPGEDHFMFFSMREAVLEVLGEWMEAHSG